MQKITSKISKLILTLMLIATTISSHIFGIAFATTTDSPTSTTLTPETTAMISRPVNATTTATNDTTPAKNTTLISQQDLQKLTTVIAEIKKNYIRSVSDHELFDNAISGMLYGLDPHSEYLKKNDLETLAAITFGKFGGIGIEVVPYQGLIKVISPLDDTPAAKAGIKAGDIIVQINNKLVKDMQLHDALRIMRGPKGSKVTLTISRKNSSKPLVFKLVRDIVKLKAVKEQIFENNIGYIRIAFFQESTNIDVAKAIAKLKELAKDNHANNDKNIVTKNSSDTGALRGLVLDLRNNPGGLLDTAVQVTDSLLDVKKTDRNNIIVYTKGNNKDVQIIARATPGELLSGVPIVVLINEGSASASEIVAGALQDYKRAVIVGTKSFGKGSVQTLLPVDNDSAIKLTTALYYTPSGRSIQAKGIKPDIVVANLKILEKGVVNDGNVIRLDESSLFDHLQNGNDQQSDRSNKEAKGKHGKYGNKPGELKDRDAPEKYVIDEDKGGEKDQDSLSKVKLRELLYKDYQLYEAINILKGLAVVKR